MQRLPWVLTMLVAVTFAGCLDEDAKRQPVPTGRIDGAVLDHIMTPFAHAPVHLVELDRWTNTTDMGGFSFVNLPDGFHTVETTIMGIGSDREMVLVEDGEVARIILQVWKAQEPVPHITDLARERHLDVASPGTTCPECGVTARLDTNRPVEIVAHAVWNAYPLDNPSSGLVTRMVMQVVDERDNIILEPIMGIGEMVGRIDMANVPPETDSLFVEFWFPEDNPHHVNFEMTSLLHLCYYQDCESMGLAAS